MVLGEMIKHVNYRMNEEPEGGHGLGACFIVIIGMICCYAIYLIFKGIYNIIKLNTLQQNRLLILSKNKSLGKTNFHSITTIQHFISIFSYRFDYLIF